MLINQTTVYGHLGGDPKEEQVGDDQDLLVVRFNLAVPTFGKQGDKDKPPAWFPVRFRAKINPNNTYETGAEQAAKLVKGNGIVVTGKFDTYFNKEEKEVTFIDAQGFQLVPKRDRQDDGPPAE